MALVGFFFLRIANCVTLIATAVIQSERCYFVKYFNDKAIRPLKVDVQFVNTVSHVSPLLMAAYLHVIIM